MKNVEVDRVERDRGPEALRRARLHLGFKSQSNG